MAGVKRYMQSAISQLAAECAEPLEWSRLNGLTMFWRLYPYWRPSAKTIVLGGLLLVAAAGLSCFSPAVNGSSIRYFSSIPRRTVPLGSARLTALRRVVGRVDGLHFDCRAACCTRRDARQSAFADRRRQSHRRTAARPRLRSAAQMPLSYHDRNKVGDSLYRVAYDTRPHRRF